jgi:predicted metal-dependent HD superfamily phosphohydrolase
MEVAEDVEVSSDDEEVSSDDKEASSDDEEALDNDEVSNKDREEVVAVEDVDSNDDDDDDSVVVDVDHEIKAVSGKKYRPGMYAVVHLYAAVVDDVIEAPNTMIGRYTIRREECSQLPKLYVIPVDTIHSQTIGMQDVGGSSGIDEEHLFLIRRMADWPAS